MKTALALLPAVIATIAATKSEARIVDEMRLGVVQHNIRTDHGDLAAPKEDGPNVELEFVFKSFQPLKLIGAPRPYVMASANTEGNTSFAAVGLAWRWEFADGWALEPTIGYAVHDGEKDIPLGLTPAQRTAFEARHQLLGSRDLFRESIALEREIGKRFAVQLYYEHLSHGQILDEGRNQGLDEAGVKFVFRFSDDPAD
jgi:lipid A 3-O-deacylase